MNIATLHALIAAVCPIDGINSVGTIWFKDEATEQQRIDAQVLMDANLPDLLGGPSANDVILSEIAAIEDRHKLPKHVRLFMILSMEREAVAIGAARDPALDATTSVALLRATNDGYRNVKEVDEEIEALKAQMVP